MVSIDHARELALSYEAAVEQPHFEKTSFRVRKKIFATFDVEKRQVVVKLSEVDQSVFFDLDKKAKLKSNSKHDGRNLILQR